MPGKSQNERGRNLMSMKQDELMNIYKAQEIFTDIISLKNEIKEKEAQLREICQHKHFNGQDSFYHARNGGDKYKKCSICGYSEWE